MKLSYILIALVLVGCQGITSDTAYSDINPSSFIRDRCASSRSVECVSYELNQDLLEVTLVNTGLDTDIEYVNLEPIGTQSNNVSADCEWPSQFNNSQEITILCNLNKVFDEEERGMFRLYINGTRNIDIDLLLRSG